MALDSLYQQVRANRLERLEAAYASGIYRTYMWPWDTLPALLLIIGMLVVPRLPPPAATVARVLFLVVIFGQGIWSVIRCRAIGMAGGYGIGLATDWGFITAAGLLWFNDLKKDFQRLELRGSQHSTVHSTSNGSAQSTAIPEAAQPTKRLQISKEKPATSSRSRYPVWQSYPNNIWHCTGWLLDLLVSFRGVNWNWRLAAFAPLDFAPKLPETKDPSATKSSRKTAYKTPSTIGQLRKQAAKQFILFYLGVDLAKTLVIHDPYYLGLVSIDSPHPLWLLQSHPILTRTARLLLSLYSVYVVLSLIFTLSPLLSPLLPQHLTSTPLHRPSMYPPQWSPSPLTAILTTGLPAFWGQLWHQMFRAGISRPVSPSSTRSLLRTLNLPPRSRRARLLQLLVAFTLTASIHALAAYTSFPPNAADPPRPVTGSGLFFLLQAVGIVVQGAVAEVVRSTRWPRWVRGMGNVGFVVMWLYVTGPVLTGDFARCGVWLFEPVPVSVFRGLLGEGWFHWGGRWAGLVWDGPWYRRGIAIY